MGEALRNEIKNNLENNLANFKIECDKKLLRCGQTSINTATGKPFGSLTIGVLPCKPDVSSGKVILHEMHHALALQDHIPKRDKKGNIIKDDKGNAITDMEKDIVYGCDKKCFGTNQSANTANCP